MRRSGHRFLQSFYAPWALFVFVMLAAFVVLAAFAPAAGAAETLPDLRISKGGPGTLQAGSTATYNLTVWNPQGATTASGVTVRDTLPTGMSFVSAAASGPGGFSCSHDAGVVTCTSDSLPDFGDCFCRASQIAITVRAPSSPTSLTNTAVIDPDNTVAEGNESNNSSSVTTEVTPPPDSTPPVITPDVSGTQGDNGWYTSDVTVSWTVTDDESQITSRSGCDTTTITEDTAGTTLTCEATSAGGTNEESVTIKRDATAPTLDLPPDITEEATNSDGAAVNYNATATDEDPPSPEVSCTPPSDSTFPLGTTTVECSATDTAGNQATGSFDVTVRDTTAPEVDCEAADDLWHADDVSLHCTATDATGLDDPADADFHLSTNVANGIETDNAETNSREVCDASANCATAGPIAANKVDKKAPEVSLIAPEDGASYTLNQTVEADYACSDGGSGVDGCDGPVAEGSLIDTTSSGARSFTVNATDNAGNTHSVTHAYTVVENSTGCDVTGTGGNDVLQGTPGDDVICGLGGNDVLKGLGGNDRLIGGGGNDALRGGRGSDTASYVASATSIEASLGSGTAVGEGSDSLAGIENLVGSNRGNDELSGSNRDNRLTGRGGSDRLLGGSGRDTLNSRDGVEGNDTVNGGLGTDRCTTDATERSIINCER